MQNNYKIQPDPSSPQDNTSEERALISNNNPFLRKGGQRKLPPLGQKATSPVNQTNLSPIKEDSRGLEENRKLDTGIMMVSATTKSPVNLEESPLISPIMVKNDEKVNKDEYERKGSASKKSHSGQPGGTTSKLVEALKKCAKVTPKANEKRNVPPVN